MDEGEGPFKDMPPEWNPPEGVKAHSGSVDRWVEEGWIMRIFFWTSDFGLHVNVQVAIFTPLPSAHVRRFTASFSTPFHKLLGIVDYFERIGAALNTRMN